MSGFTARIQFKKNHVKTSIDLPRKRYNGTSYSKIDRLMGPAMQTGSKFDNLIFAQIFFAALLPIWLK